MNQLNWWLRRRSGWLVLLLAVVSLSGCAGASAPPEAGVIATNYVTALDRADTDAANRLLATTVTPWPATTPAEALGPRCRPTGNPEVSVTGTLAQVKLSCATGQPRVILLTQEAQAWKVFMR